MWNIQANNYSQLSATKAWMSCNLCQQQQCGQGHVLTVSDKSSGFDSDFTTVLLYNLEKKTFWKLPQVTNQVGIALCWKQALYLALEDTWNMRSLPVVKCSLCEETGVRSSLPFPEARGYTSICNWLGSSEQYCIGVNITEVTAATKYNSDTKIPLI